MPNYTSPLWTEAPALGRFPRLAGDLTVDVAIVGAGITGVTAARLLKDAGLRVALVESRRVGQGETSKTTAHLTEILDTRLHTLIARFGVDGARLAVQGQRAALDRIAAFIDARSIACDFQRLPGFLYTETPDGVRTLEAEAAAAERIDLPAALTRDVPLPFPVFQALRFEHQAQFHPRAYLHALCDNLDCDGSHVFEETHVSAVEDGEPCRVVTALGVITARDVIVAAHVPITNLVLLHTKLAAYRTYAVAIADPPSVNVEGLFWDTAEPYHYTRQQIVGGTRYLIVGGEDHKVGENDDTTASFKRLEQFVLAHFGQRVAPTDFRWSGQIIESADGLPYVGRNALSRHTFVATGFSGNGMTNGTLAAMVLADEVRGVSNQWSRLLDATRIKPLASAKAFISENVDYPKHLIGDRIAQLIHGGDVGDIAPGEGAVLLVRGTKLAIHRNGAGELSALSPVCTHLGCLVHWNTTAKSWDCPCHGSRFDPTGHVLNGPAVAPLEAKPLPPDLDEDAVPVQAAPEPLV